MNILGDIYNKSLTENESNIKFWEEYLQNLKSLDFNVYSEKLTVPVLVPIGNRILFRGALKHTNEVTVALGADYFTKCSIKQADVLRQHRIKDAQSKLENFIKERDYLENQISFSRENVYRNPNKDIIEMCTEEEDKTWREKHKEKVRQYHQSKDKKKEDTSGNEIADEELWARLEELELQEELENELSNMDIKSDLNDNDDTNSYDSLIIKEDDVSNVILEKDNYGTEDHVSRITHNIPKQTSKMDLLQQVIDRQQMLETKLAEIKNRDRDRTKTENDLLSRLDEIQQLDEMEDEMDRLDDILEEDDTQDEEVKSDKTIKKCISFHAEDDSETLEINFTHAKIEPNLEPYDPDKGITKPSDIYHAFPKMFSNGITSILKKSKYESPTNRFETEQTSNNSVKNKKGAHFKDDVDENMTIVVKDVIERANPQDNTINADKRPTSLFKKKRQMKKLA